MIIVITPHDHQHTTPRWVNVKRKQSVQNGAYTRGTSRRAGRQLLVGDAASEEPLEMALKIADRKREEGNQV